MILLASLLSFAIVVAISRALTKRPPDNQRIISAINKTGSMLSENKIDLSLQTKNPENAFQASTNLAFDNEGKLDMKLQKLEPINLKKKKGG